MAEIISCRSCRHSRFDWVHLLFLSFTSPYAWKCDRIKSEEKTELDPVSGKAVMEKSQRKLCVSARSKYGECGEQGQLWEPKSKKNFLVYLKRI